MRCKISNNTIEPFMSFGRMPIANAFLTKDEFVEEFFFDMEVGFSEKLSLFQLNDHPPPKKMFNENYPFFTESSEYMKIHFKKYADWIKKKYLHNSSKIIEIGSNDGTFLSNFDSNKTEYLGIEPSKSVANIALEKKIKTIKSFFSHNLSKELTNFRENTDVIIGANVICHVPNLTDLIKGVDNLLSAKGVFIFEEPYLGSMFKKISYDQIYDEHIYMFSAVAIQKIFKLFDMDLIDVLPQTTHGGSLRYVISRKNQHDVSKNVELIVDQEKNENLDNIESCLIFKKNCELSKENLKKKIEDLKKKNMNLCGYAATSKSTTILNYCKIGINEINFICDTTKEKIGKYSPGMHIPIVSTSHFNKAKVDYAYLFAWNHKNEIFKKEIDFKNRGGKWFSHVEL